jgi:hypothetical protein
VDLPLELLVHHRLCRFWLTASVFVYFAFDLGGLMSDETLLLTAALLPAALYPIYRWLTKDICSPSTNSGQIVGFGAAWLLSGLIWMAGWVGLAKLVQLALRQIGVFGLTSAIVALFIAFAVLISLAYLFVRHRTNVRSPKLTDL